MLHLIPRASRHAIGNRACSSFSPNIRMQVGRPRRISTIPTAPSVYNPGLELQPEVDADADIDVESLGAEDFGSYSVILPPEPYVWGTEHIRRRPAPGVTPPPYVGAPTDAPFHGDPYTGDGRIALGSADESRIRRAGALARDVLRWAGELVKPGVTTEGIDARIHDHILSLGAYPSPLGYGGFPKSCCTSVNNIVAHGIPDDRPLEDGDIVNIDITIYIDGVHGDTSRTFLVGDVDEPGRALVSVTEEALEAGIRACCPEAPFSAIGRAICDIATKAGYAVSQQFTGHGIGTVFHRPPFIVHTVNQEPGRMLPGHCFTIEPSLIQGSNPRGWIWPDGWTASTEVSFLSFLRGSLFLDDEELR